VEAHHAQTRNREHRRLQQVRPTKAVHDVGRPLYEPAREGLLVVVAHGEARDALLTGQGRQGAEVGVQPRAFERDDAHDLDIIELEDPGQQRLAVRDAPYED
jgi:hypothetical protein